MKALTSVKFGALRDPDGGWSGYDGRPGAVKNFAAYSLQRLGVDHIDVYRIARADPGVPIEETVGAIAELVEAGHVRHIGLSEVGAETIRRAAATAPISDLQIEYSLISRGIEDEVLPTTRELGIGITAYGVLSRGLISGHFTRDRQLAANDFRGMSPASRATTSSATSTWSTRCGRSPSRRGQRRADRDRLGALARRGHRAAGRCASPGPADGGAGCAGRDAGRRRPRFHRGGRAGRRRRGRPLSAGADGAPRHGALTVPPGTVFVMARTTEALTAERILEATEEVLRRHGPAKATVVDVARALGVSHGSVYRHFRTKAALREAVTKRWLDRTSQTLEQIARTRDQTPPVALRHWLGALFTAKRQKAGRSGCSPRTRCCSVRPARWSMSTSPTSFTSSCSLSNVACVRATSSSGCQPLVDGPRRLRRHRPLPRPRLRP